MPPQDRQFWPPKRGSKSKASNQAAFIGLSCTTSVAEDKRKTPQKIASKGAKICKKDTILGSKNGPVLGFAILFFKETSPKTCPFLDFKMVSFLHIFAPFDAIFCCCILTCLLIETGAWLVLVARQGQFNGPVQARHTRGHFIRPCPPPKIQPAEAAPKQRPIPA